jgi:hypothetical protein
VILNCFQNAEVRVKNKVLELIQRAARDLKDKFPTFDDTKASLEIEHGVIFPAMRDDFAAAANAGGGGDNEFKERKVVSPARGGPAAAAGPDTSQGPLTKSYVSKLKENLELTVEYIFMARDMLANVDEGGKPDGILKGLVRNLKEIQSRLMNLIVEVEDDDFVAVFIKLNELVHESLIWYASIEAKKNKNEQPKMRPISRDKLAVVIHTLGTDAKIVLDFGDIEVADPVESKEIVPAKNKKPVEEKKDDMDDMFMEIASRGNQPAAPAKQAKGDDVLLDLFGPSTTNAPQPAISAPKPAAVSYFSFSIFAEIRLWFRIRSMTILTNCHLKLLEKSNRIPSDMINSTISRSFSCSPNIIP